MPRAVGSRCLPAQDVEIAVVREYLEKDILRAVPLVYHLFDHVLTILKSKTNRSFVDRPPVSRLSWKWRRRSFAKIAERTYEKRAQALHRRGESSHPEATPLRQGPSFGPV